MIEALEAIKNGDLPFVRSWLDVVFSVLRSKR